MSSAMSASAASASPLSCDAMKPASSSRSAAEASAAADHSSRRPAGRCSRSVARPSCSALLTAATPISSTSPTSRADHPSTSLSTSAARWQELDDGEERQLDRLAPDDRGVRLVRRRRRLVEHPVGIRLQPRHVAKRAEGRDLPKTAAHPKKLVLVPGGHFDAYVGRGFEISSGAARDWFVEHLVTAAEVAS